MDELQLNVGDVWCILGSLPLIKNIWSGFKINKEKLNKNDATGLIKRFKVPYEISERKAM